MLSFTLKENNLQKPGTIKQNQVIVLVQLLFYFSLFFSHTSSVECLLISNAPLQLQQLLRPYFELPPNCITLKLHHQISFRFISIFCSSVSNYLQMIIERDRQCCSHSVMFQHALYQLHSPLFTNERTNKGNQSTIIGGVNHKGTQCHIYVFSERRKQSTGHRSHSNCYCNYMMMVFIGNER